MYKLHLVNHKLLVPLHSKASMYVFVFTVWLETVQQYSSNNAHRFCSTGNIRLGVWGAVCYWESL